VDAETGAPPIRGTGQRKLDYVAPLETDSPERRRTRVTENSAISTSEYGGHPSTVLRERRTATA
jgi:hypothetical protein